MEARITNIEQFRAGKAELIAKHGEKLIMGTNVEMRAILKDCEPLAKYAKIPPERLVTALARAYVEKN